MTKTATKLLWRGMFVEVKHRKIPEPHFELMVEDKKNKETITFKNVQVTDPELVDVTDLMQLPYHVRQMILDSATVAMDEVVAKKKVAKRG